MEVMFIKQQTSDNTKRIAYSTMVTYTSTGIANLIKQVIDDFKNNSMDEWLEHLYYYSNGLTMKFLQTASVEDIYKRFMAMTVPMIDIETLTYDNGNNANGCSIATDGHNNITYAELRKFVYSDKYSDEYKRKQLTQVLYKWLHGNTSFPRDPNQSQMDMSTSIVPIWTLGYSKDVIFVESENRLYILAPISVKSHLMSNMYMLSNIMQYVISGDTVYGSYLTLAVVNRDGLYEYKNPIMNPSLFI